MTVEQMNLPFVSIKADPDNDIAYMTFHNYQELASDTAIYPERGNIAGIMYCGLGLASEAGEVAGKIKKYFRDGVADKDRDAFYTNLEGELGDVLWYLAMIADEFGLEFGDIARGNIEKLASRKARGVLGGSGDNR